MLGSMTLCHLLRHCLFIRPGTSAAIATQFLPPYVCTASFRFLSSSADHVPLARSMLASKTLRFLLLHCFCDRPWTRAAILPQFLAPCVCTASFSLLPSPTVQLLSLRQVARSMLTFKTVRHRHKHCFFVRRGTSAGTVSQSVLCSLPIFFLQVLV
jgi:hypothetical protein